MDEAPQETGYENAASVKCVVKTALTVGQRERDREGERQRQ